MTSASLRIGWRLVRAALIATAGLLVVVPSLVVAGWMIWPREIEPQAPFTAMPLDLNVYDVFDVGIVDADGNGALDIFTTNHDARQSLLLGDGHGGFSDGLTALGLDQQPEFPGLEDSRQAPAMEQPGLYIFFQNRALHVVNHVRPTDDERTVAGVIDASLPVETTGDENVVTAVEKRTNERGAVLTTVDFSIADAGRLEVQYPSNAVPIRVSLAPELPLAEIFVGAKAVNPTTHDFALALRDRHGMAWTDLTDDGRLDLFISRGGLFGWMPRLPEVFVDELLISTSTAGEGQALADEASLRGISKNGCSGRQTAWVDVDRDGKLDLYVACGRGAGGFWDYVPRQLRPLLGGGNFSDANQLWMQQSDGNFIDRAAELGVDFSDEGTFAWLDVGSTGKLDLIWASEDGIFLHRNDGLTFSGEAIEPTPLTPVRKLLIADIDRDGDSDVFAAAALGSRLLINDGNGFSSFDPETRGLPAGVRTAAWVDFDNDGRIDLHAWPDGLFRQTEDGAFEALEVAGMASPYWWLVDPRVAWFDMDNDGSRDLLVAQRWFPFALQNAQPKLFPFWAALFRNDLQANGHWLQVELTGPRGNRSAIGAQVVLETKAGAEIQQVGQADTAHYSQGHYRLYFGLGDDASPERLTVRWPDGHVDQLERPAVDRLLQIERDPNDGYTRQQIPKVAMASETTL